MRKSLALPIALLLLVSSKVEGGALEDCLAAFPVEQQIDFARALESPAGQAEYRKEVIRRLALIRRASAAGHLPSQYLYATWFNGAEEIEPPVEGLLERNGPEKWRLFEELARSGFALAEYQVGMRAKDAGFFPERDVMGKFDEAKAAESRRVFFEWMTRSASKGNKSAWEALARFYPSQIDEFGGTFEDRIQGYAWAHLYALTLKDSLFGSALNDPRVEAEARLKSPEESSAASALASRYEKEVFPRLIRYNTEADICRLKPQFRSSADER